MLRIHEKCDQNPEMRPKNANKVPINEIVIPLPYPVTFIFAKCDQIIRILYWLSFYSRSRLTTKEKDRCVLQRKRPLRFTKKKTATFHNGAVLSENTN